MPRAEINASELAAPVQVIAVTGGKGGTGKTSVAVNLATALAQMGRKTMLLDGDLGLANVDVLLGLTPREIVKDSGKTGHLASPTLASTAHTPHKKPLSR